jgi:hypothetical protein
LIPRPQQLTCLLLLLLLHCRLWWSCLLIPQLLPDLMHLEGGCERRGEVSAICHRLRWLRGGQVQGRGVRRREGEGALERQQILGCMGAVQSTEWSECLSS